MGSKLLYIIQENRGSWGLGIYAKTLSFDSYTLLFLRVMPSLKWTSIIKIAKIHKEVFLNKEELMY